MIRPSLHSTVFVTTGNAGDMGHNVGRERARALETSVHDPNSFLLSDVKCGRDVPSAQREHVLNSVRLQDRRDQLSAVLLRCFVYLAEERKETKLDFKGKEGKEPESPLFFFHRKKAAQVGSSPRPAAFKTVGLSTEPPR